LNNLREFRFTFLVCWMVWFLFQVLVLHDFGIGFEKGILDSLVSNLFLAGAGWLIQNNMRYYLPRQEKYWYVLFISFGLSGIWIFLIRWILGFLFQKDPFYLQTLIHSSLIRFEFGFLVLVCISSLCLVWFTQKEQKEMEFRARETEKWSREAELFKLRQQLQPHFLFNSLNSINALISTKPEKARSMILQLSDFLRRTLNKEEQVWVNLDEEIQYLNLYLEIEKVRFGHRLSTQFIMDESSQNAKIPPLVLQPLLENAIKFGLYDTLGDICIRLKAKTEENNLFIFIENPFDPETCSPNKGTGFGLRSISRRLYLLFGRKDLLETKIEGNWFYTTLLIPQIHGINQDLTDKKPELNIEHSQIDKDESHNH